MKEWILYLLVFAAVRTRAVQQLYGKIGEEVVLNPHTAESPITAISWKHGTNSVAVWQTGGHPSYHGSFSDRTSLVASTGILTIRRLTKVDSGIYTPEINTKESIKTHLHVISAVPKPTVSVSCGKGNSQCTLTCNGNIAGAEPVTYWWKADYRKWTSSKTLTITEEDKEEEFSCIIENPVSSHHSEEISNPYISDRTWIYILVAVIVVLSIIGFSVYKYRNNKGDDTTVQVGTDLTMDSSNI